MKKIERGPAILLGAWLLLLLISLTSYFIWGNEQEQKVLFFPRYRSSQCEGESRILPRKDTAEAAIELLIDEILLGPMNVNYVPVVAKETKLQTILYRNNTLYVDLSDDPIFGHTDSTLSFQESLDCIAKSVQFNFPEVERIEFTINGFQPDFPRESQSRQK